MSISRCCLQQPAVVTLTATFLITGAKSFMDQNKKILLLRCSVLMYTHEVLFVDLTDITFVAK